MQIIIYPNSVTVNAGNSVLFACAAYGNPAPGFVWMRGDDTNITTRDPRINITQELVEGNGIMFVQSILEFCTVVVSDSSQYSCTAVASQKNCTCGRLQIASTGDTISVTTLLPC